MPEQKATDPRLPNLPIMASAAALHTALSNGHVVLSAEPGSGKTTLVPLLLRDEPWLDGRGILMLEPRRAAARMAARRMAALLGEAVGQTVGYQVRFERRRSVATRIEVVTEGLLLRRLQRDPELADVGLIIFDEFHERSLHSDLSLALCMDVAQGLRDDLRLLVMSASLDAAPLTALLSATALDVAGRSHPVDVHQADADGDMRNPIPGCLRAIENALVATRDDVLVFLPGRREIDHLCEQAAARWGDALTVLPLYGELPAAQQDAVIQGGRDGQRRLIVSTDIAETSLTIEGVGAVVDSGLARRPRFDPATGLTRLTTQWISKASALQRAGRAGRLGPGLCFRIWNDARQARLDDHGAPEIRHADLAALVLELANWGLASADDLDWLERPPAAAWRQAATLLRQLDALDQAGRITPTGRQMARLPLHPRLAHLLVTAANHQALTVAADIAALLSERDPLRHATAVGADIEHRLRVLSAYRRRQRLSNAIDAGALREIDRVAAHYRRLCECDRADGPLSEVAACVALAYPERVAVCSSSDGRRYRMRNGRAALLRDDDPLRGSPWLAIAAVDAGQREGRIHLASALEADQVEQLFAAQIESAREVRWDAARDDVVVRVTRRLGAIVMHEMPDALAPDDPVLPLLFAQIRARGLSAFFDDKRAVRVRVELMRANDPASGWPDFSEHTLLATLEDWLSPWLKTGQGRQQLRALDLDRVLESVLGWDTAQRLARQLPLHFETPAGTQRKIQYSLADRPVLAVPLQEMLGLTSSPTLADGRIPLLLHLLSPAGRVLQVTADLAAFWAGAYPAVKKEMRGRYPKHDWPDDPATAKATRFSRRRSH